MPWNASRRDDGLLRRFKHQMICPTCLAIAYADDESKDALIAWQAAQIDRLTGGWSVEVAEEAVEVPAPPPPPPDVLATLVTLLGHEDIFRRPGRIAAPRLLERLTAAGIHVTNGAP